MSPSCECEAATQPPAQTGMNAQSPHSFQGASRSNFSRADLAPRVLPVVDVAGRQRQLAGEAGARVERAVGADRVRVLSCGRGTGRCARRRASGTRGACVSSRRNVILSSRNSHESHGRAAAGARRRHAGAVQRLVRRRRPASAGCMPFGAAGASVADDRLEVHLRRACRRTPARAGSRAAPDSCRPSSRRSCRRWRCGTRPATRRMFSTMRSKVPWPPRSGRIRLCVSRSPSSVILTPFRPNGSIRSTTSGVSSRPLVMMLIAHADAARLAALPHALGQVVHHRQVQQRLAAEERQHELLGLDAIELALDPVGDARRGLERHLLGELVVVAVIALEAVVAGEVALQRRQQRDVAAPSVSLLTAVEVGVERRGDRRRGSSTRKPFSRSRSSASRSSSVEPSTSRAPRRTGRAAPRRRVDTTSCASVSVFIRNTSSRAASGTRRLNIEGCIDSTSAPDRVCVWSRRRP